MFEKENIIKIIDNCVTRKIATLTKSELAETEIEWGKFCVRDFAHELKLDISIATQKYIDDMAKKDKWFCDRYNELSNKITETMERR